MKKWMWTLEITLLAIIVIGLAFSAWNLWQAHQNLQIVEENLEAIHQNLER